MRIASIIIGLLLVFGGIGGMEVDDITLANVLVTVAGLLILAIGAPFHE
jgi:hypothetical protein